MPEPPTPSLDPLAGPLPDPRGFDPVRFPGTTEGETWPPPAFDFQASWLREAGLAFERDPGGGIGLVRPYGHMRMLADIDTAHLLLDIAPGSRDFRLLRLVPAALRCVERIRPGDRMPGALLDEDPEPIPDQHLEAATAELVKRLAATAGEEGEALAEAMHRSPPGPGMFETAIARCITQGGFPMGTMAPLGRRLQLLANAHARVLAAAAMQPDYAAMERMVARTRDALGNDRRWVGDLLTRAMEGLAPSIARPRRAAEGFLALAEAAMRRPVPLEAPTRLIREQLGLRDRLLDLSVFWQRLAAAWLAVDPATTDRREIEALARNALRRLALEALYRMPD
ncbi:hypothetical protein [Falsiroseomonas selenitidurans]|uniref:Uncharacterized protein n=1 Tax=Falsiroseomonas selenitidurans TaxID=2716335 RepID=A0ABX1E153_9PROT|nr:hypothetical protein [Falsiroseomonas selenitidurans]NKC30836.1 hypothetical protein [Falsiroseomonas selenitidurans]